MFDFLLVVAALTGTLCFIFRAELADAYQSGWRPLTPQEAEILAVLDSNIQSLTLVFVGHEYLALTFGEGGLYVSFRTSNRLIRVVEAKWQVERARRNCLDNEKSLALVRGMGKGV